MSSRTRTCGKNNVSIELSGSGSVKRSKNAQAPDEQKLMKHFKDNVMISVDNTDENDFPLEDEVDLHPSEVGFDGEDDIYDENGQELLAANGEVTNNKVAQMQGGGRPSAGSTLELMNLQHDPIFKQLDNRAVEEKLRQG